jgi:aldehyde dehydrogenase (NAD+)
LRSSLLVLIIGKGGKSPFVVFDDCDLDVAVATSHQAIFFNQGQVCTAGSRVFVQDTIYDKFLAKAKEAAEKRCALVGDPFHPETAQGAQVSQLQFTRIMEYIDHGKKVKEVVPSEGVYF